MNRQKLLQELGGATYMEPVVVVKNQDVRDIINLIKHKHQKCASDYDKIAENFWKGNVYDTCQGLFNFCKKNIKYQVETEAVQTVSQPSVILSKGVGDCKHYSLFIAGVLDALKRQGHDIDWRYRFASYDPFDTTPGHVFVIVKEKNEPEIWIDPVLDEFDYHKSFSYAIDKKVDTPAAAMGAIHYQNRASRLGLSAIKGNQVLMGRRRVGTTAQTGALISKISVAVAAVPIYPFTAIIGGAGALVGFFLTVFGNKYSTSTGVRWLTQLFQYFVEGNCSVTTDNKVDEGQTNNSHTWFAYALGVPVYDRYRFDTLKGVAYQGGQSLNQTFEQRANAFLQYPEIKQAGITYDQALAAVEIADTLSYSAGCGGWNQQKPAPQLIDLSSVVSAQDLTALPVVSTSSTGTGIIATLQTKLAALPSIVKYGAIALVLLLLLNDSKK